MGKLANVRNVHPYLPHHLYRREARGEARVNFPTTYVEYGLVGKLRSTSPPHLDTEDGLVGKSVNVR